MNTETLKSKWQPFDTVESFDRVFEWTKLPLDLCKQELQHLVPCIELQGNSPILRSVVMVTPSLLCEVRRPGVRQDFDFISRNRVVNYRFQIGKVEIKDGETVRETLDFAEAVIVHDFGESPFPNRPGFCTVIPYVGKQVDAWKAILTAAIPVSSLS